MAGDTYRETAEAVVTDTNDPDKLGRIKIRCESLFGDSEEYSEWVDPDFPMSGEGSSLFFPPEVGETVKIEYSTSSGEDAVYAETFMRAPRITYQGGAHRSGDDVPEEFSGGNYGKVVGIRIKGAGTLAFRKDGLVGLAGDRVTVLGALAFTEDTEAAVLGETYYAWMHKYVDEVEKALSNVGTALSSLGGDTLVVAGSADPVTHVVTGTATHVVSISAQLTAIQEALTAIGLLQHEIIKQLAYGVQIAKDDETG